MKCLISFCYVNMFMTPLQIVWCEITKREWYLGEITFRKQKLYVELSGILHMYLLSLYVFVNKVRIIGDITFGEQHIIFGIK